MTFVYPCFSECYLFYFLTQNGPWVNALLYFPYKFRILRRASLLVYFCLRKISHSKLSASREDDPDIEKNVSMLKVSDCTWQQMDYKWDSVRLLGKHKIASQVSYCWTQKQHQQQNEFLLLKRKSWLESQTKKMAKCTFRFHIFSCPFSFLA